MTRAEMEHLRDAKNYLEAALDETGNYEAAKFIGHALAMICNAQHAIYRVVVMPVATDDPVPVKKWKDPLT